VISVDDHVVEPPHTFEGRLPASLQARAPRVVETRRGHQVWEFEGRRYTQVGMNVVAGRRPETVTLEPFRFDQMRRGCYDVDARVHDMDINGVWASLNFPSQITGFCGSVFADIDDHELGLACVRAWNDWLYEEWYAPHPTRIVPLGITYLADAASAAAEIRRNAARGFRSVTWPERPHALGLPSLWDREHPLHQPTLKIALSEGGIGWVAMLLDRLDYIVDHSSYGTRFPTASSPRVRGFSARCSRAARFPSRR
jgi:hypothetical protein